MSTAQKLVLITGGNQGIGFETAKNLLLSSPEYHVILGCRDLNKAEAAIKELQAIPEIKGSVSATQLDVTDDQSVDAAATRLASDFGKLDILINNAGIISTESPPTREALRKVLEVNIVGTLSVTEAFLGLLRKATHVPPRIIFVSSSMGSIQHAANTSSPYHNPHGMEYRTSKAALNMMMIMYHARLKSDGFLVFGVDPGLCATNFTGNAESLKARGAALPSDGGDRVASAAKGERDEDVGKVLSGDSILPF
ncbi:0230ae5e-e868-4b83-a4f4-233390b6498b [Sclerotinia trifoliorum]|uniref:0230ae5e-e868-4b83-a4f4-233390b6498b n=1 Tax=Sclerotinia trifoliorum TaxID=28548 RepID=A0A8H2VQT7_9HELO|nr:0230ae5e-e868-4b83-a4f4-233390b6498b [Sclerotinia trifoliorum]